MSVGGFSQRLDALSQGSQAGTYSVAQDDEAVRIEYGAHDGGPLPRVRSSLRSTPALPFAWTMERTGGRVRPVKFLAPPFTVRRCPYPLSYPLYVHNASVRTTRVHTLNCRMGVSSLFIELPFVDGPQPTVRTAFSVPDHIVAPQPAVLVSHEIEPNGVSQTPRPPSEVCSCRSDSPPLRWEYSLPSGRVRERVGTCTCTPDMYYWYDILCMQNGIANLTQERDRYDMEDEPRASRTA